MKKSAVGLLTASLVISAFTASAELTNLVSRVHVDTWSEFSTVYKTRGAVIDSRPSIANSFDVLFDLDPFGFIGGNVWANSAMSRGGQSYTRRNAFNEVYYAVYAGYDLEFSENWSLLTVVGRGWDTLPGYNDELCKGFPEWLLMQSLENPYVTPYYTLRRAMGVASGCLWEVGLRRKFELYDRLYLTVNFSTELSDRRHLAAIWGENPCSDDGRYDAGFLGLNLNIRLAYYLTEWLNVYVYVHQFDTVNSDFRETLDFYHRWGCPEAVKDITYGGVGLQIRF